MGSPESLSTTIAPYMKQGRVNLVVPLSSDQATACQIISELKKLRSANSELSISLLGHPDWHTFTNLKRDFASFGTHIYTPFYVEDDAIETSRFSSEFRNWYERSVLKTYPSYAMWGYDTALFFMTALQRNGLAFEQNINNVSVPVLQFPSILSVSITGGLINGAFYILEYTPSGEHKEDKNNQMRRLFLTLMLLGALGSVLPEIL